jgi:hypothetical protein
VQQGMNRLLDVRKVYKRKKYRKKTVNKIRRKTKFHDKMRENSAKLITENKKDLQYSSGIAGPFKEDRRQPIGRRKEKVQLNSRSGPGGRGGRIPVHSLRFVGAPVKVIKRLFEESYE